MSDASARKLSSYLRVPDGEGPWPGVVVLHDIFGQTVDSRRQVDWLAGAGYLAVAPDLFSWSAKPLCILATIRDLRAGRGKTFDAIEAVRRELTARVDCRGHVGVIGFCLGGGFAVLLAAGRGFVVSSVNYGPVPRDADVLLRGACPVVGSFGGRDPQLKGAAARLEAALRADGVAHDVREYPDAGHGFLNAHEGRLGRAVRAVGMGYHDAAAADAKARILAFFETHLT